MKFEIADWRFEVTWDGLRCQPIERGRAKAAKKPASRPDRREGASKSTRHAIGRKVETQNFASLPFDKQTHRKGAIK